MSSAVNASQLQSMLDKLKRSYPAGIPKDTIAAAQSKRKAQAKDCVLVVLGVVHTLEERLVSLADAIGTKGLRLTSESFAVQPLAADSVAEADLQNIATTFSPRVIIVCGGALNPGVISEVAGAVVLSSYSLCQIADDVDTKKRFWEHLKLIMPRLSARA